MRKYRKMRCSGEKRVAYILILNSIITNMRLMSRWLNETSLIRTRTEEEDGRASALGFFISIETVRVSCKGRGRVDRLSLMHCS